MPVRSDRVILGVISTFRDRITLTLLFSALVATFNTLAGQGLRQFLQHGDVIQYDCHEGTIEAVGYTHVSLRTDQGVVTIPNTVMLNATIVKRRSAAPPRVTTNTSKANQPR
jgi:hypothetical protein